MGGGPLFRHAALNRLKAILVALMLSAGALAAGEAATVDETPNADMAIAFAREVDRKLDVPAEEQIGYAERLQEALSFAGLSDLASQYVVMVDRSPAVQAAFIYWRSLRGNWHFIGASSVSTGKPGAYEHFLTPLGVFEHSLSNMDFRAEGTRNQLGIRGYGVAGKRVFDFGWVIAERGWGPPGRSAMRLQMHATDPDVLEPRLGEARSEGCIRIPAKLDDFIDRYGLLDADYERAVAQGRYLWVLRPDRRPTPWPGRYLVVIDSGRTTRPEWSPGPAKRVWEFPESGCQEGDTGGRPS